MLVWAILRVDGYRAVGGFLPIHIISKCNKNSLMMIIPLTNFAAIAEFTNSR